MKKLIKFIFIIALVLFLIFLGAFFNDKRKDKNVLKDENKVEEFKEKTISGFVASVSNDNLFFRYQNRIYLFSIKDVIKDDTIKMVPGDFVMLTYEGDMSLLTENQNVKVKRISLGNKEKYKEALIDNGIFKNYYSKAYQKMESMTLDEKIGQLFFVRVPNDPIKAVKENQFGGYILFGKDIENKTKDNIVYNINSWNKVSNIPLLIATDEEGGTVVRVSSNKNISKSRFNSPQYVYKNGGMDAIKSDNIEKNKLLYSLGINVNLAPVADVSVDPNNYIYNRSFGKDAKETSNFVRAIISSSKGSHVSNVLKHFPGYGNNSDTHTGISIDNRSLNSFREVDFLPFEAGIEEGAESILVSHNIIVNIENNIPASLSFNIHKLLRNELLFNGIIMTDDLAMDAIGNYVKNPSIEALKAGNDMIMVSDYEKGISEIKDALSKKAISENLINESAIRVLAWKYYKGLIE